MDIVRKQLRGIDRALLIIDAELHITGRGKGDILTAFWELQATTRNMSEVLKRYEEINGHS